MKWGTLQQVVLCLVNTQTPQSQWSEGNCLTSLTTPITVQVNIYVNDVLLALVGY
jgi:hypothetical protein